MIIKIVLQNILWICVVLILVRVLLSYFPFYREDGKAHPIINAVIHITDTILAPFEVFTRGIASRTGIDFAPLIALIVLQMLSNYVSTL